MQIGASQAGVQQVIGNRLSRLSTEARSLLHAASVLGDGLTFDLLADTSRVDVAALLAALDEVLLGRFLREEPDGYHCGHALIRDTVYAALSAPRRQLLHLHAAEACEQAGRVENRTLSTLALHYRLAGPAGAEKALEYATRAATAAEATYAWEQAVAQRRAALTIAGTADPARRCHLLLDLAETQARAGDDDVKESCRQAAALARSLKDARLLARAALGFGRALLAGIGVDRERQALLEEALAALGAEEPALRTQALASLVQTIIRSGDGERLEALSTEALALARQLDDPAIMAEALGARHNALRGPERLSERLSLDPQIIQLAVAARDPEAELYGRLRRMRNLLEPGDMPVVDAEIELLSRGATHLRQPHFLWRVMLAPGMRALLRGDLAEAERRAGEAMAFGSRAKVWQPWLFYGLQMIQVWEERAALAEILPTWEARVDAAPAVFFGHCAIAWISCELGLTEKATRAFERLAANQFAALRHDIQNWLAGLSVLAQTCAALGDRCRAAELYDLLLPYADRQPCVATAVAAYGAGSRYLGLPATTLERWDEASEHFEAALAMNARIGANIWLARTQLDYARLLLMRTPGAGRRAEPEGLERVAGLLEAALATARELGLTRLARQVEDLAASPLIARPLLPGLPLLPQEQKVSAANRPEPSRLPSRLSPREVEVLGLIAAGRTNNEIAAELVLSPATVQRHTVNLYRKLGVRGRAEATAFAFRHGLVQSEDSGLRTQD